MLGIQDAVQVDPYEGYYDGPFQCPQCSFHMMLDSRWGHLKKPFGCPFCGQLLSIPAKLDKFLLGHLRHGHRTEEIETAINVMYRYIDEGEFQDANTAIEKLEETLHRDDPELVRARAFMVVMGMDMEDEEIFEKEGE